MEVASIPNTQQLEALDIQAGIERLAAEIKQNHPDLDMAFIGLRSRGDEVALRVMECLGVKVDFGVLDISLYRDDLAHLTNSPRLTSSSIDFPIEGRRIVLVDDVFFTGRTVRAAINAIMDYGRPGKIELAVLVDRGHRELPFCADYTGISLSTQRLDTVEVLLKNTDGQDALTLYPPSLLPC